MASNTVHLADMPSQTADQRREWEEFAQKLSPYPHLFQLKNRHYFTVPRLRMIKDKVEKEREGTLASEDYRKMGRSRDGNLIAFLAFLLDDAETAMVETDKVLREDERNLVAGGNRACFLWWTGDRPQAEKCVEELNARKTLHTFGEKVTEAKAEMAYCYSRMGIPFALLAVEMFEEVVRERPQEHDWKLGLAMTLRRFSYVDLQIFHSIGSEDVRQKLLRATDLLQEIKCQDLKGQAWAELGYLMLVAQDKEGVIHEIKERVGDLTDVQCLQNAIEQAPKNPSVLFRAGSIFRKHKLGLDAIRVLEQAASIKGTSEIYCNLGLAHEGLFRAKRIHSPVQRQQDENFKRAMECYQTSLDVSYGQNPCAHLHLGLLHQLVGETDKALAKFRAVLDYRYSHENPHETLDAYNRCGQIKLKLSEQEQDAGKKEELRKEAEALLHISLDMQCQITRRVPTFDSSQLAMTWKNLQSLMRDAMRDSQIYDQLKVKARLLYAVKDYKNTLRVLDEISQISDEECQDAHAVETKLDCYIRERRFEDAVTFVNLLGLTQQREQPTRWENPELPLQTFILAARKQLLKAEDTDGLEADMAREYFRSAFEHKCTTISTPETESADSREPEAENALHERWQVMVLHDPHDASAEAKISRLRDILAKTFGLTVTYMADDVNPAKVELFGVSSNMENSQLLLIMAGAEDPSFEFCQGYLGPAVTMACNDSLKKQILVLKTTRNSKHPKELGNHRSFLCPEGLLTIVADSQSAGAAVSREEEVKDICDLFCSLVDTNIDQF